jgi:hypothetical protein
MDELRYRLAHQTRAIEREDGVSRLQHRSKARPRLLVLGIASVRYIRWKKLLRNYRREVVEKQVIYNDLEHHLVASVPQQRRGDQFRGRRGERAQ